MATAAKYAKETFWAIASKGTAFLFYYALVYYLTRTMSVEQWGNWSAFLALLNILMLVSDQGINTASKRYIAEARDSQDLAGVIRATLLLRVLASLLYVLLIAFFVPSLLRWLGQADYLAPMQRGLLLIGLYGIMEYFKGLFEALHRLSFTFVLSTLEHGLKLLLVLLLFRGGDGFVPVVTAFIIAVALAIGAGVVVTVRTIPGIFGASMPAGRTRQTYLYSLPIFLMSIGGFIALEIDTIMLKHLRAAYETDIYAAAKNIVLFLPHLSLALSMGIVPGLSVFDAQTAGVRRQFYYKIIAGIAGIYLVICLLVGVFATFGLTIFFKSEYEAAAKPLLVLIPFVFCNGLSIFTGNLLDYRGLAAKRSLNFALTIVANILLNWWWIPKWGAVGAAAASSIAFAPYCALNLWQAHNAFRLPAARND